MLTSRVCTRWAYAQAYAWNHQETFNWALPVFATVMIIVAIWYAVSAHKWFKGPKVGGTPEELAAIERELALKAEA